MKAFARTLYVLSWAAFYVAWGDLAVSLAADSGAYDEVVDELPTLEADMGRIFFFGTNRQFLITKPTLSINGEELDGPYGKDIFFFVDRVAGEYVIAVDGKAALRFDLGRGGKRYVVMDSGTPINPKDGFFQPDDLGWVMTVQLLPERQAEAVMKNMRWKK